MSDRERELFFLRHSMVEPPPRVSRDWSMGGLFLIVYSVGFLCGLLAGMLL